MRAPTLAALTVFATLALTGCEAAGGVQAGASAGSASPSGAVSSPPVATGQPSPSPSATGLPDVCALLSRAEVSTLTGGKSILSVDPDPGPSSQVRYCQWQLSGARLAIQLSPTTEARFRQDHPTEARVPGLGDDSFFFSNHLFVRKGTIQVDVYAGTTQGTAADQQLAKAAAALVLPRL
jgi:hypothetical protein